MTLNCISQDSISNKIVLNQCCENYNNLYINILGKQNWHVKVKSVEEIYLRKYLNIMLP